MAVLIWVMVVSSTVEAQSLTSLIEGLHEAFSDYGDTQEAESWRADQQADGCWNGIDYQDQSAADWDPVQHLVRVRAMASAYNRSEHPEYHNPEMESAVLKGLDCWYRVGPTSTNWWWRDIGKQRQLGPIGILMRDRLGQTRKERIIADLPTEPKGTGQNRVWYAQGVVYRGCLEQSGARVQAGFSGIEETITVSTNEGIQYDWSFHQHGPQLYSLGYGLNYIQEVSFWAAMTYGTPFAFPQDRLETLLGLLLDGDAWMVRGKMLDPSATGRVISRQGSSAEPLLDPCRYLAPLAGARAPEVEALRAYIEAQAGPPISGNRHFWRSDFMTHQRPGFYGSVKMCSERTIGVESLNEENLLGYWLPFGMTVLAPRGDEYDQIFPLWDWTLLPGVTAPSFVQAPKNERQPSVFVGGASSGTFGVAAMRLDKAETHAHKAWFFFDQELVALGTGIQSTHASPVRTAVNQCVRRGSVRVNQEVIGDGARTLKEPSWLHHDGLGYLLLEADTARLNLERRTGSWHTINQQYPADQFSLDTFTLFIEHGVKPKGAQYQYAVFAAGNAHEAAIYATRPPIRVITNTPSVQAARQDRLGVAGVVFHVPGRVQVRERLEIAVDQACLIVMDESQLVPRITVADPTGQLAAVSVDLMRPGRAPERLKIELPVVPHDGRSVTVTTAAGEALDSSPDPPDGVMPRLLDSSL